MRAEWVWYALTINEEHEPASIAVDLSWRKRAPIKSLPWLLCIRVPFLGDSGGVSAPPVEESRPLGRISDDLALALKRDVQAAFVGRLTTTKFREFFHYAPQEAGFEAVIDLMADTHRPYVFRFASKEDQGWRQYLEFLYPSERQFRWMEDRDTVALLRKNGDSLSPARRVRHWIFFPTPRDRSAFAESCSSLGFVAEREFVAGGAPRDRRFGLEISRVDIVELDHIHGVVLKLVEVAATNRGDYDGWESQVVQGGESAGRR